MNLRFDKDRRALHFERLELRCLLSINPGDFSADGKVDAADYVLWRNADPRADSNGDTHIDQTDYNAWRSNFGNVYSSQLSFAATDVPITITDEGLIQSHLTVTPSASIDNVKIQININHPYDSDLQAYLISPTGTRVQLFSGIGESGANFQGTIFDDDAETSILDGEAPFTGTFRPSQSLSAFEGHNTQGIWTLEVSDHFAGDVGTLLGWTLAFNDAPLHGASANNAAVTETRQPSPTPTKVAALSTSAVPNEHSVQSKAQTTERSAASTQSTLQPEMSDLLLSIHSFSQPGAERIQTAAAELLSTSKKDSELKDSIVADDLIGPDFRSFEQI